MINKILLGTTGITVSRLGLGSVKFGRNQGVKYPTAFNLPSDDQIQKLLYRAQSLGINLLDTAPAYGSSEERIGKLLNSRTDWVITTKVGETFLDGNSFYDFSADAINYSIECSLRNLKTDYVDIVLVHSNGDDKKIIEQDEVFITLDLLKKSGKIRSFGMSTKTVEGGLLALQHSDLAMVTYNPNAIEELPVIEAAAKFNKGIFIKKAFGSGHLVASNSPTEILKFILNQNGVTSVILGTINEKHLEENAGV